MRVVGHDAANVPADAEVVYSTAVPEDNPERAVARERGQAELHRADLLAEITALRRCIAVTRHARQDDDVEHGRARAARLRAGPGYLVGGDVRSTGSNAGWGTGSGSSSRPTSPTARC